MSLDSDAFLLRHTQVNNGCGKMVSNSIRADRHGSIVRTIDPADTQKYFHESAFLIRVGKLRGNVVNNPNVSSSLNLTVTLLRRNLKM